MATLIVHEGSPGERRLALEPGVVMIGSDPDNDIRLAEEPLVSPRHASLQPEVAQWFVRDEGSEYGTFLNDRRVKEHGLQDGDVIELGVGGPRMRFVLADGDAEPVGDEEGATEVRRAFRPEDGPVE